HWRNIVQRSQPPSTKADTVPSKSPSGRNDRTAPMNGPAESGGPGDPGGNGREPGVTLTAAMAAVHGARHLREYTRDPFLGFFNGRSGDELIAEGSLLDHPNVRRWFELFDAGLAESLYTYQLPLSTASGPSSAVLGEPLI